MKETTTISSRELVSAVHTAVAELPTDTHIDDILDCVYGIVGPTVFDAAGEPAIRRLIGRLR